MGRMTKFLTELMRKLPPIKRLAQQRDEYATQVGIARLEASQSKIAERELREELSSLRADGIDGKNVPESLFVALAEKNSQLKRFGDAVPWVPNGHFYSPVPPRQEVAAYCETAFLSFPRTLPDLDLRESEQLKFVEVARGFYADLPFQDAPIDGLRYHYNNQAFRHGDGIMLNSMIRHVRPKRVVEIGSGHSSCMLLDTNEIWFNNSITSSFIEPYPELLNSLLKPEDHARITVYPTRVQEVQLEIFAELAENDILFIDSTHVSRVGSDVNHILFNILPTLAPGVIIHFHDIIYPFEYFRFWLEEGRAWNEAYLLRAFLQNNKDYEILMFNSFMNHFHKDYFSEHLSLCTKVPGGSIWLRKLH